jgi:hypothetical protein
MKITKQQLKQLIKEEMGGVLNEATDPSSIKQALERGVITVEAAVVMLLNHLIETKQQ